MRVLLVEDDEMIGQSLKQALGGNGWSVDWVKDGLLAQSALSDGGYACVLLDLGLPKRDGIEVLRKARSEGDNTPVLVLTARDGLDDRITGLDIGADDYLVKPYEFRELLARMRAVIRRRDGAAHSVIGGADLQLDITTREVLVQGERSQLSAREFALLHALLERPGAILSRDQLESRIYGWGEEVSSNAVDVLIHGMRRKLGADTIRNVRGLGWRIAASNRERDKRRQRRRGARHDEIPQCGRRGRPARLSARRRAASGLALLPGFPAGAHVFAEARAADVAGAAVPDRRRRLRRLLVLELPRHGERVHGQPDGADRPVHRRAGRARAAAVAVGRARPQVGCLCRAGV